MVADVSSENPEDYVFGNIGGMVGDTFQVARHQQRIQRLSSYMRLFVHLSREHDKGLVSHAIDYVIHFQHCLGQVGFSFYE